MNRDTDDDIWPLARDHTATDGHKTKHQHVQHSPCLAPPVGRRLQPRKPDALNGLVRPESVAKVSGIPETVVIEVRGEDREIKAAADQVVSYVKGASSHSRRGIGVVINPPNIHNCGYRATCRVIRALIRIAQATVYGFYPSTLPPGCHSLSAR